MLDYRPYLLEANVITIENQPAFKNPQNEKYPNDNL